MKLFNLDFSATPWWAWVLVVALVGVGWLGIRWASHNPRHRCDTFGPEAVNSQPRWYKTDWSRYVGGMMLVVVAALSTLGLVGNVQVTKNEELSTRNVVLAMDCSKSMTSGDMDPTGKISRIQYTINDTVAVLGEAPADINFGVFCFGAETVRISPITPDREFVIEAVKGMSVSEEGGTLMGAGVQRALDALAQAGGGMVVVVSDGAEFVPAGSSEKLRFDDAVQKAVEQGDIVSTVAYGDPTTVDDPPDIKLLQNAASQSGGFYAEAQKPGELAAALSQVEKSSTAQMVTSELFGGSEKWIPALVLVAMLAAYGLLIIKSRL
jgi:hypothetical protein